jgi:hypothetical protein
MLKIKNNLLVIGSYGLGIAFAQSIMEDEQMREKELAEKIEQPNSEPLTDFDFPTMAQLLIAKQNAFSYRKDDYLKKSKHNNRKKKKTKK